MTINCKGKLLDLSKPRIMGILNLTPDSFYDGGRYESESAALEQASKMLEEGADIIDIGGYSSRPGATEISEQEEVARVIPLIEALVKKYPDIVLSIDSYRSEVVRQALDTGAALVNDISGGLADPEMLPLVARYQVPIILMHMKGMPDTMMHHTEYEDLVHDILYFFSEQLNKVRSLGINDLIVDPGFGFSKTRTQNFELLNKLELFQHLEVPVLAGISRKSMIYKTLGTQPEFALNGTTALHMICLQKGASLLRVHDVREARECIELFSLLKQNKTE